MTSDPASQCCCPSAQLFFPAAWRERVRQWPKQVREVFLYQEILFWRLLGRKIYTYVADSLAKPVPVPFALRALCHCNDTLLKALLTVWGFGRPGWKQDAREALVSGHPPTPGFLKCNQVKMNSASHHRKPSCTTLKNFHRHPYWSKQKLLFLGLYSWILIVSYDSKLVNCQQYLEGSLWIVKYPGNIE